MELLAGSFEQPGEVRDALRVLDAEAIALERDRPVVPLVPERAGRSVSRRRGRAGLRGQDSGLQRRHPEISRGRERERAEVGRTRPISWSIPPNEHGREVEPAVRGPRSRPHPLVDLDRVLEMARRVVQPVEGCCQEAQVAVDGADAPLGVPDGVASRQRLQLPVQRLRPLGLVESGNGFRGEARAQEPLVVGVQGGEVVAPPDPGGRRAPRRSVRARRAGTRAPTDGADTREIRRPTPEPQAPRRPVAHARVGGGTDEIAPPTRCPWRA